MDLSRRTDDLILPSETNRFVVLGDPHGDLAGLDTVLRLESSPGTAIVSAGDNVGYVDGPTSSAFCRRLRELGIRSVFGNHEAWLTPRGKLFMLPPDAFLYVDERAVAFCRSLPLRLRVEHATVPDLKVGVIHTLLDLERDSWDYVSAANAAVLADAEGVDVVFVGHTHGPTVYAISPDGEVKMKRVALEDGEERTVTLKKGSRYVVDCGSLGRPGFHPEPARFDLASWGFIDFEKRVVGVRCARKAEGSPQR